MLNPDNETITPDEERVCRAICEADGVNPDLKVHGVGATIVEGWSGPAWKVRLRQARAAIAAQQAA